MYTHICDSESKSILVHNGQFKLRGDLVAPGQELKKKNALMETE